MSETSVEVKRPCSSSLDIIIASGLHYVQVNDSAARQELIGPFRTREQALARSRQVEEPLLKRGIYGKQSKRIYIRIRKNTNKAIGVAMLNARRVSKPILSQSFL